ncbi:pyridoxal phosphate homeostasis protein-like [Ciona intestinalis]
MKYKIMPQVLPDIAANLAGIRTGIDSAVQKRPQAIPTVQPILVAVSKTKPLSLIKQAYDAGQRHFGENYLKELVVKSNSPDMAELCPDVKWHYIGTFQKKMASVLMRVSNLHMLETLNGAKEADAVNSRWKSTEPLQVLVQVNTSGEESKSGVTTSECIELVRHIHKNCSNLKLSGLMTIGSFGYDCTQGPNPDFTMLSECRKTVCKELGIEEKDLQLSMGMSHDYTHAIEMGSTMVRVGTAIFGARDYNKTEEQ